MSTTQINPQGITAEKMLGKPRFRVWGSFTEKDIYTPQGATDPVFRFKFDFIGGELVLEVDEEDFEKNAPKEGAMVRVAGVAKYSSYDGTIRLIPDEFDDEAQLDLAEYQEGLVIEGYGEIASRDMTKFNRDTFYKASIRFPGGFHLFNKISAQTFSTIPLKGSFVSFKFGVQITKQKNQEGNEIQKFTPEFREASAVQLIDTTVSGKPAGQRPNPNPGKVEESKTA